MVWTEGKREPSMRGRPAGDSAPVSGTADG